MDVKELLDPKSPQASYGSAETTTSCVLTPSTAALPGPSQSDFDKIEVLPEKEKEPKPIAPKAVIPPIEQRKKEEYDGFQLFKIPIFLFSLTTLAIRCVFYRNLNFFFEPVILAISVMSCTVITCFLKRGRFAKKWEDLEPVFQSKPRSNYPESQHPSPVKGRVEEDSQLEPQGTPLTRLTNLMAADIHRSADVESSQETSCSSRVSKGHPPSLVSQVSSDPNTPQDVCTPTTSQEDSTTDSQETSGSAPTLKAFRNLFRRRN